jgi:hypothetical protein
MHCPRRQAVVGESGGDEGVLERQACRAIARGLSCELLLDGGEFSVGDGGCGVGFGPAAAGLLETRVKRIDFTGGGFGAAAQALSARGLGAAIAFDLGYGAVRLRVR